MLRTIIFFGPSGSGKGTQAELLEKYLKKINPDKEVIYFGTGERLRAFVESDTHTSRRVKEILNQGGLLPAFLTIWAWAGSLIDHFKEGGHLIFDGICRKVSEAPVFDGAMKFYKREKPEIVVLHVSEEWAMKRLKERGRHDDKEGDIRKRLDWYKTDVLPTIEFFKNNPDYQFHEINGEQTIENVHQEIIKKLELLI